MSNNQMVTACGTELVNNTVEMEALRRFLDPQFWEFEKDLVFVLDRIVPGYQYEDFYDSTFCGWEDIKGEFEGKTITFKGMHRDTKDAKSNASFTTTDVEGEEEVYWLSPLSVKTTRKHLDTEVSKIFEVSA